MRDILESILDEGSLEEDIREEDIGEEGSREESIVEEDIGSLRGVDMVVEGDTSHILVEINRDFFVEEEGSLWGAGIRIEMVDIHSPHHHLHSLEVLLWVPFSN